ncbi:hypothetical protein Y032_0685g1513 [Ancylostoma ceylanicum]|uniref:Uncharacterized protein n=1 Tax=Ancylostoma ceylanicum TaxID=53326 RepID=A0A016WH40_9BILA|nr:hypothetical protein Y032_0685g1513 [Ancylostoma ceylanicum]
MRVASFLFLSRTDEMLILEEQKTNPKLYVLNSSFPDNHLHVNTYEILEVFSTSLGPDLAINFGLLPDSLDPVAQSIFPGDGASRFLGEDLSRGLKTRFLEL